MNNNLYNFLKEFSDDKYVDIDALINVLKNKYHSTCKGCDARAFIEAFSNYIRLIEKDELDFNNNLYRTWIECRINCFGKYGNITKKKIDHRLLIDYKLYNSIKKEGLICPIEFIASEENIEINGYHRVVILKELGMDKIPYIIK